MSYLDQYIRRKLRGSHYKETSPDTKTSIEIPLWVTQVPQAKNAKPFDGRPACDGRGTCVPLCPSRAKYEAVFHVEKAVKAGAEDFLAKPASSEQLIDAIERAMARYESARHQHSELGSFRRLVAMYHDGLA